MKSQRMPGAEVISARIKIIGREAGLKIERCDWDIGEDFGHTYAHRLDVFAESGTVRLYFTDLELMTSNNEARRKKTETALQNAIAKLASASRAPTYNFDSSELRTEAENAAHRTK
jgi:hypothetical protein